MRPPFVESLRICCITSSAISYSAISVMPESFDAPSPPEGSLLFEAASRRCLRAAGLIGEVGDAVLAPGDVFLRNDGVGDTVAGAAD